MFDVVKQDFSKVAESGYTFELIMPNGVNSGAKLTVLGEKSPAVKLYGRRKFQEWQQRQAIAKRRGKEDELDLDEAEDVAVEAALVRLIGWEGIAENGKEIPFTKEKAAEILKAHEWIREAIMTESADILNFSPKT